MPGTALLHGALRCCRKCVLHNFSKTSSSKVIYNKLHLSQNARTFHQKSCYTAVLTQRGPIAQHSVSNKRYFAMSYMDNAWIPWLGSSEPPVIPKSSSSTPSIQPPQDTVMSSSTMSDAASSSPVDAAFDSGVLNDAVSSVIIDPPFTELGLATKWFPNHFVHQLLEFVHLNTGLEWWSTIILGTLVIRILTIPLFVLTRKITINAQNHAEEIKQGHNKLERYKYSEDTMRFMVARKEMLDIYKRTGTGPLRTMLTAPSMSFIFISCVMALRQMAAVPVPSFLEGGVLWFTDLSMPDPYYALPIITGGVMGLYIHTMLKSGSMPTSYDGIIRKAKYLPIFFIPLVLGKSSSAIFLYWLTTSVFSLTFVRMLAIPGFKKMIGFPEKKPALPAGNVKTQTQTSAPRKGVWETVKNWKNDSYTKTYQRMQFKEIARERKRAAKEQKKILKGKPPVTYEIGVDAMPATVEVPDFEKEWRPNKPKHLGY